jgi:hypothetical protein
LQHSSSRFDSYGDLADHRRAEDGGTQRTGKGMDGKARTTRERMKTTKAGKAGVWASVTHGQVKRRSDAITEADVRQHGSRTFVHMGLGYVTKPLTMDMVGKKYGHLIPTVRLASNAFLTDKGKSKKTRGTKKPAPGKKPK